VLDRSNGEGVAGVVVLGIVEPCAGDVVGKRDVAAAGPTLDGTSPLPSMIRIGGSLDVGDRAAESRSIARSGGEVVERSDSERGLAAGGSWRGNPATEAPPETGGVVVPAVDEFAGAAEAAV
jgi:hypothetical protein